MLGRPVQPGLPPTNLSQGLGWRTPWWNLYLPWPNTRSRSCCTRPYCGKLGCGGVRPAASADLDAFLKSPEAVIGPGETVVLPPVEVSIFYHEAELGVVIGRKTSKVPRNRAMDYVFGYVNFIDVSVRGLTPKAVAAAS